MGEFFSKLLEQMKEILGKLDLTKKIIIGGVSLVVVIAFILLFSVSSGTPDQILFDELSSKDFGQVTKKLEEMGLYYSTDGTSSILVKPSQRELILTKLAQEKMIPQGIPGWKLFDVSSWTETDKELDVKHMRALRGEIRRHIESLKNIEKASVEIAIPEDNLYTKDQVPYSAAVTLHLASGYERLKAKEIKGITYLVSRAVGNRLKPENVTVTNDFGKIISDFDDEIDAVKKQYTKLELQKKIEEKVRVQYLRDIKNGLGRIFSEDRIQIVRFNMDFNWDKITEDQEEYTPIIKKRDNPATPYSEEETQDSLIISESDNQEDFQGHGFNPEGPAGTEGNLPPGYKASDDQFAKYKKRKKIRNHALNKTNRKIIRDDFDITKVSASIVIDGKQNLPMLKDGTYDLNPIRKVEQKPLSKEDLKKAENIVKKAINFNADRGDQVAVENIMFDRTAEWEVLRDEYRRKEQMKKLILAALVGVVALFVGFILFRAISKEFERRRRIKEEELALQQQRMREAALRAAEDEGIDVELSLEEKARLELHETATSLAKERPDDVAALLRTWLAEE